MATQARWITFGAVLSSFALGCTGTPGPDALLRTAVIGPGGGTLALTSAESTALAGTSLTVPAGALAQEVTITARASSLAVVQLGDIAAGPVVDLGPEGTQFAVPVMITLPVAIPAGEVAADLRIEAVEGNGAARALGVGSQAGGFATFETSTFTRFGGVIHHPPDGGSSCAADTDCSCAQCLQGQCQSVICSCPAVPAGCAQPGPGPCCCPMACDAGAGACASSADCGSTEYCATATCGGSGACLPRPQACPQHCTLPEACGCDGQRYCNACLANAAGTTLSTEGSACADAGAQLSWYTTCGYPICMAPADGGDVQPDGGPCPALGSPCASPGARCGTASAANCGVTEVCSQSDPKLGGCPISSRRFKEDIAYLDDAALERLHAQILRTRLATFRYQVPYGDPASSHLGFILEDQPSSPAVDDARAGVDLYSYLGMIVATTQVQERELSDLRRELAAERANVCAEPAR